MSVSDFQEFIKLIQGLIPKFQLFDTVLDVNVQNQIKLTDSVSINVYINKTESPSKPPLPSPKPTPKPFPFPEPLPPDFVPGMEDFPFTSGVHLRVNQPSWWDTKKHICIGSLKVIPLLVGEEVSFEGIERPRVDRFEACLSENETLEIKSLEESRIIDLSSVNVDSSKIDRSKWTFKKYSHEQVINFDTLPGIVLSLNETVAEKAIVMKREHNILPPEYYVLVLSLSNTNMNKP